MQKHLFSGVILALLVWVFLIVGQNIEESNYQRGYKEGYNVGFTSVPTPMSFVMPERACLTGDMMIDGWSEGVYVWIGETQICAEFRDNTWVLELGDTMASPDYSATIYGLEKQVQSWQDCAEALILCEKGFVRNEPTPTSEDR